MTILEHDTIAPSSPTGLAPQLTPALTSVWPSSSGMFDTVTLLRVILTNRQTREGVMHALVLAVQTWAESLGDDAVQAGQHQQGLAEILEALRISAPQRSTYELAGELLETRDRLMSLWRGADLYWFVDDYDVAVRNIGLDALREQVTNQALSDWDYLLEHMVIG